jgi:hypothetical protein
MGIKGARQRSASGGRSSRIVCALGARMNRWVVAHRSNGTQYLSKMKDTLSLVSHFALKTE